MPYLRDTGRPAFLTHKPPYGGAGRQARTWWTLLQALRIESSVRCQGFD